VTVVSISADVIVLPSSRLTVRAGCELCSWDGLTRVSASKKAAVMIHLVMGSTLR
jgi:hypothetical protein